MVKKGNKEWNTISIETTTKKKLQEYKRKKKYHSDSETIEALLEEKN